MVCRNHAEWKTQILLMSEEQITIAYVRLRQLEAGLGSGLMVGENSVGEFHSVVDTLMHNVNVDLSAFRIPDHDIRPREHGAIRKVSEGPGMETAYCRRSILMKRIRGLLNLEAILFSAVEGRPVSK